MKLMNRRKFIKQSSGAVAAGFIAGKIPATVDTATTEKKNEITLEYRTLGKTGLRVTSVGYGAMRTSDPAVLERALDMGINFVDTAHVYQDGNNEIMVGDVVSKRRKDVILCTKIIPYSKGKMKRLFEKSLRRLKTDYVDVLYLHSMKKTKDIENDDAMELLQQWKQEGKIRFMGFSTHKNETELLLQASKDRFWEVILVAYNFEKEKSLTHAIHTAAQVGIGIVGMKTQAGGYKTDSMGDLSQHQAALKWVLQNPHVHSTIPSMTTFSELEEDVQVMGKNFGWNDRKILHRYSKAIEEIYCRSCGKCIDSCPYNIDIPEINRCIMYAEGYGDLQLARANFQQLAEEHDFSQCFRCSSCQASCVYGINLAKRMSRLELLTS